MDVGSRLGKEVFDILEYYYALNIKPKLVIKRKTINIEVFSEMIGRSCIVEELLNKLMRFKPEASSILEKTDDSSEIAYILKGLDTFQTRGELGFEYNMEHILQNLLEYYKRTCLRGRKEPAAPLHLD